MLTKNSHLKRQRSPRPAVRIGLHAAAIAAGLFFAVTASAETCEQSPVSCEAATSNDCVADCQAADCWSIEGRCSFDGAVAVDPACGCVDPQTGCSLAHGREQSRLYRRTIRRLRACALERGGTGVTCPDARTARGIARLSRGVQNRGRAICGRPVTPFASEMAGLPFGCATDLAQRAASDECAQVIAREGLRYAMAASRLMSGCVDGLFNPQRESDSCLSDEAAATLERAQRRLGRRVNAACVGEDLDSQGTGCPASFCAASAGATEFSATGCVECCGDWTARELAVFAYDNHPLYCGDGVVIGGEDCDEGLTANCDLDCTTSEYGDGTLNPASGEQCDDGNTDPFDRCDADCLLNAGCPTIEETVFYGRAYGECTTNADCPVGFCELTLGRCRTQTISDEGWTGIGHGTDLNHGDLQRLRIDCDGGTDGDCGECAVLGLAPWPGQCRCANDPRVHCDEGFSDDADDCDGNACICFAYAPRPLSVGNTPLCNVPRYDREPTGTVDLSSGARALDMDLRAQTYLGERIIAPCPYCEGDTVVGDGVRDGVCRLGVSGGLPCDADAANNTYPAFPSSGGGHTSLDCMPDVGKNISGEGLRWSVQYGTGATELGSDIECGFPPFVVEQCHCGVCEGDFLVACRTDADCNGAGPCRELGSFTPFPNQCRESRCEQTEAGDWRCALGPNDRTCDGILDTDGRGILGCLSDQDCAAETIGIAAGLCTHEERRSCFPTTIARAGRADSLNPVLSTVFCDPGTTPGVNSVRGTPGPIARSREGLSTYYCDEDLAVQYVAGVRDCLTDPVCGDGVLDNGEQCDDGNLRNSDGCSSICDIEP